MFTEEGSKVPASPLTQPLPSHPHILQQLSESDLPPFTDYILKPDPARQPKPNPAALEAGLTLPSKASKRAPAEEGVGTLGEEFFSFSKCFIHESTTQMAPPTQPRVSRLRPAAAGFKRTGE